MYGWANNFIFCILAPYCVKSRKSKFIIRLRHSRIKQKLEVFWLPSYSPELNPDEYLNCDLKRGLSDKQAPKNVKELQCNVENHMNMLQQTPERVAKYFKHKDIQYAA